MVQQLFHLRKIPINIGTTKFEHRLLYKVSDPGFFADPRIRTLKTQIQIRPFFIFYSINVLTKIYTNFNLFLPNLWGLNDVLWLGFEGTCPKRDSVECFNYICNFFYLYLELYRVFLSCIRKELEPNSAPEPPKLSWLRNTDKNSRMVFLQNSTLRSTFFSLCSLMLVVLLKEGIVDVKHTWTLCYEPIVTYWRIGWIATGRHVEKNEFLRTTWRKGWIHLFLQIILGKITSAERNWINSVRQTAATTFGFSSFIHKCTLTIIPQQQNFNIENLHLIMEQDYIVKLTAKFVFINLISMRISSLVNTQFIYCTLTRNFELCNRISSRKQKSLWIRFSLFIWVPYRIL